MGATGCGRLQQTEKLIPHSKGDPNLFPKILAGAVLPGSSVGEKQKSIFFKVVVNVIVVVLRWLFLKNMSSGWF